MNAREKTALLLKHLRNRGIDANAHYANILRRAELTLHRWYELECGDGNKYGSWAIERDDNGDGPPYMVRLHYKHGKGKDTVSRTRIADKEAGAIRRVKAVCEELGLSYYPQTDPRGAALYVAKLEDKMTNCNYSSVGVCCAID